MSVTFSSFIVAHSANELVHSGLSGPCEAGRLSRPCSHGTSTASGNGLLLNLRRLVWFLSVGRRDLETLGMGVDWRMAVPAHKGTSRLGHQHVAKSMLAM